MSVCEYCGGPLGGGRATKRYCSESCRRRGWDRRSGEPCARCGGPTSDPRKTYCASCAKVVVRHIACERARPRREVIQRMWLAGATMSQIAAEVGCTISALSKAMILMRRAGWDLPYRQAPSGDRELVA